MHFIIFRSIGVTFFFPDKGQIKSVIDLFILNLPFGFKDLQLDFEFLAAIFEFKLPTNQPTNHQLVLKKRWVLAFTKKRFQLSSLCSFVLSESDGGKWGCLRVRAIFYHMMMMAGYELGRYNYNGNI